MNRSMMRVIIVAPVVLGLVVAVIPLLLSTPNRVIAESHEGFVQTDLPHDEWDTTNQLFKSTTPGILTITILPAALYDKVHPGTAGITYFTQLPCAIEIPDNWGISFVPYTNEAWFTETTNAQTLAHEILHCMIPHWHDGFSERLLRSGRAR